MNVLVLLNGRWVLQRRWTCGTSLDACLFQLIYFVISMCIGNPLTNFMSYWLYFEWYFAWLRIGITNQNQMNDNLKGMECLLLTPSVLQCYSIMSIVWYMYDL